MYKHVFGPVPSRRLGISLGVDLVVSKSCNLNCIFCECGATKKIQLRLQLLLSTKSTPKDIPNLLDGTGPNTCLYIFSPHTLLINTFYSNF